MSFLLEELNQKQKEAVLHKNGPLLIIAGAGSGKTKVLTKRIAYLIEQGVSPYEILAITFTNKAANEMKERINKFTSIFTKKALWISTFHSLCNKILRQEIKILDYDNNFNIYDSNEQEFLIKKIIKEQQLNDKIFIAKNLLNLISKFKNNFKNHNIVKEESESYYEEKVAKIYQQYQTYLKKYNSLDFDDLIYLTVYILNSNNKIKNFYQNKFKYISIDEYQDINFLQFLLIKLLTNKENNICVVGDPDQSIYGWRGADLTNILNFEKKYKNTKIIYLEQNYRSNKYILEAANNIIKNNVNRKIKNLWTNNNKGDLIVCFEAIDEIEEAAFIAREIEYLCKNKKKEYKDFAIFYRTNGQSRNIEKSLTRYGINYKIFGNISFFKRKEIKDIIAYLQFLNNPSDIISFERIINTPKRGIGQITKNKIIDYSKKNNINIEKTLIEIEKYLTKTTFKKIKIFKKIMDDLKKIKNENITNLIKAIIKKTKYIKELEKLEDEESKDRISNINEFLTEAKEFDINSEEKTLDFFLSNVALYSEVDDLNKNNNVTLITLHMAKGLEYKIIFIIGMEEGILPHYKVKENLSEIEEERRLFYVGITRGKEKVYLTRAWQRNQFGLTVGNAKSRFLNEIPEHLLIYPYKSDKKNKNSKDSFIKNKNLKENFNLADHIYHNKFGDGMIVKIENNNKNTILSIAFPNIGIKRLISKYAPIKKIKRKINNYAKNRN